MTPAARLQASIEISQEIAAGTRPADAIVADWLRDRRFVGSKDRRHLSQAVYDRLRRRARLTWWCQRAELPQGEFTLERSLALAELVIVAREKAGAVAQLCSGQRFGPEALTPRERRALESLEGAPLAHREQPDWVQAECPEWLWPRFGPGAAGRLAALAEAAPLDLRVNLLKAARPEAIKALVASRFRSHSQAPGEVSSKSLMPNAKARSAVANTPKFPTCMSPQAWTRRPVFGVIDKSRAIIAAAPRRNANGDASMRA